MIEIRPRVFCSVYTIVDTVRGVKPINYFSFTAVGWAGGFVPCSHAILLAPAPNVGVNLITLTNLGAHSRAPEERNSFILQLIKCECESRITTPKYTPPFRSSIEVRFRLLTILMCYSHS